MSEGEKQFGRALAVDDEPSTLKAISRILKASCEVVETLDSTNVPIAALIDQIREKLSPNLLLTLDGQYSGGTAEDIIEALKAELTTHETHVVVATGHSDTANRVKARFHRVSVLEKPFGVNAFSSTVSTSVPFTA